MIGYWIVNRQKHFTSVKLHRNGSQTIAEEIIRKLDYSIRVEAVLKNEDGQMLTFKFARVV